MILSNVERYIRIFHHNRLTCMHFFARYFISHFFFIFLHDSCSEMFIQGISTNWMKHVLCDMAFISMYGCQNW